MGIFGFCGGDKQMRRILLFMFLICMIGTMCSCSKNDSNEEYYTVSNKALDEESNRIKDVFLESLSDKDVDKLQNEFSSFAKENANLKDEINNAFGFIDGNITSIGSAITGLGAAETDEKGYVRATYEVSLFDVKTDKNRTYEIRILGNFFYRNNEHKQGIYRIHVRDKDIEYDAATENGTCVVGVERSE